MPVTDAQKLRFIQAITQKLRSSAAAPYDGYTDADVEALFHEMIDDRVDALIQDSATVTWVYDDNLGTLTATATASGSGHTIQEEGVSLPARSKLNFIGAAITATDNAGNDATDVTLSQSPASASVVGTGRTISAGTGLTGGGDLSADRTISIDTSYLAEFVDDEVALLIQNGTGISWSYNDPLNTLTPTVTLAPFSTTNLAEGTNLYFTDERVDDRVAALMISGTGTTWTYNDPGNTLKVDVSLSPFTTTNLAEGANLYFTDERVDDRVAALIINTSTITWSYNDPGNTLSASVVADSSVQKVAARKNSTGGDVGTRRRLNFIEGTNVTLTVADDGVDNEIDVTIAATGGGSADIKQTEIDFGSTPVSEASFTVVDAGVSGSSQLTGQVAYEAPTGKDLDEVEMDAFHLSFGPGSGQFTLFIQSLEGLVIGKFKINYLIG